LSYISLSEAQSRTAWLPLAHISQNNELSGLAMPQTMDIWVRGNTVFHCVQSETSGAIHYHSCFGLESGRITHLHCFPLLQCHAISASRPERYCRTMGPSVSQENTRRYWLLLKVSDKKIDGPFEYL